MANQSIQFEEYHSRENGYLWIDYGFPMEVSSSNFPYVFGITCDEMQWECDKRGWEGIDDMPYSELHEKIQIVACDKINVVAPLEVDRIVKMNADLQEMVVDLRHEKNEALLTIENLNDEISRLKAEVDILNSKPFMYAS